MTPWLPTAVAALFYSLAFALRSFDFLQVRQTLKQPLLLLAGFAVAVHGIAVWRQIFEGGSINLSLLPLSSSIFWVINLIVVLSAIRNPLENLIGEQRE